MSLHSRLPAEYTLEDRVTAINQLCDKLHERGRQIERLRWRVAIELYVVQGIVLAEGLQWEAWCRDHINRSLSDIRKLIKMATAHDPEAAHQAEIAASRASRQRNGSKAAQRSSMIADNRPEQSPAAASAALQLIIAILTRHSISEARALLNMVEMRDLIDALNDTEVVSASDRAVRVVSTATH